MKDDGKRAAASGPEEGRKTLLERMAAKVPDPVVLFILMYAVLFVVTIFAGGTTFSLPGIDPATGAAIQVERTIRNMSDVANIQWIFDNAIVDNWLAYAHGLIGILVVAMLGIGTAEGSGLFSVLLKLAGGKVNERVLPYIIVFAGVLSNVAADAGYVVLIPLAAALYCAMGRNPLIGERGLWREHHPRNDVGPTHRPSDEGLCACAGRSLAVALRRTAERGDDGLFLHLLAGVRLHASGRMGHESVRRAEA